MSEKRSDMTPLNLSSEKAIHWLGVLLEWYSSQENDYHEKLWGKNSDGYDIGLETEWMRYRQEAAALRAGIQALQVCDSAVADGEGPEVTPSAERLALSATGSRDPISTQPMDRLAEIAKNAIKERDVAREAMSLALATMRSGNWHEAYRVLEKGLGFRADGDV